jgi:glycosyltransferase involved in cell wall biosynthesis
VAGPPAAPAARARGAGGGRVGRPLRVALDATPLLGARTGVGSFTAGAMRALAARPELDVRAFTVSWRRRGWIVDLLPPGVTPIRRPMPARPVHWLWRRFEAPPFEWLAGGLDVVHGTNFVVPPTRRTAAVVTVHDLTTVRFPELCHPATRAFPELIRRALRRGAWVHTPSAFVAGEVVELLGADPGRVRVVHLGIEPGPVAAAPPAGAPAPLPAGAARYLLAVGTIEPRKDLPLLVRAFDRLAAARRDVALVVAGPDGWGAAAFDHAVAAARHRDRVVRLGWVDDATRDRLLRAAAALAYPSVYEGFGFPPLEAMAAGVPVVATRAGALPEVLGDAAELVAVGDEPGLAGALARVLDDPAAAAELVRRGRRLVAGYTWERCAAGLAALYQQAARG